MQVRNVQHVPASDTRFTRPSQTAFQQSLDVKTDAADATATRRRPHRTIPAAETHHTPLHKNTKIKQQCYAW